MKQVEVPENHAYRGKHSKKLLVTGLVWSGV